MGNKSDKIEEIIDEEEEARRKEIIEKENNKRCAFKGYKSIKNFLVDYIYGDKIATKENCINMYLISTKSIPKFSKYIEEMSKEKITNEEELKHAEKKLKDNLLNYVIEENIIIYNDFNECLEISKKNISKDSNEFIIVDEQFLENFNIKDSTDKFVSIIDTVKKYHSVKILFPESNKELLADEIENKKGYFYFLQPITSIEDNNPGDNDENNTKFLSLLENISRCLLNIKSFNDYISYNQQSIIIENNNLSENIIFNLIKQENKNTNTNSNTNYIDLKNSFQSNKHLNIIEKLYNLLHNKFKTNNYNEIIMNQNNNNNVELNNELLRALNEFNKEGKSIVSNIFLFQDIITYQCDFCNKQKYKSSINNHIIFDINEISQDISKKELNIIDCFNSLTTNKNEAKECEDCKNNVVYSYYRINSIKEVLTIILNRENNNNDDIKFNIDININLGKYFFNQQNKTDFELIGVCGYNKYKDKYSSYYKDYKDNLWYYYKDSKLVESSQYPIADTPIILLYKYKN